MYCQQCAICCRKCIVTLRYCNNVILPNCYCSDFDFLLIYYYSTPQSSPGYIKPYTTLPIYCRLVQSSCLNCSALCTKSYCCNSDISVRKLYSSRAWYCPCPTHCIWRNVDGMQSNPPPSCFCCKFELKFSNCKEYGTCSKSV